MKIGIGTYSLFWEMPDQNPEPLSIAGMINRASALSCDVFQICDDPRVDELSPEELTALRTLAESLGIALELGTRSIDRDHLARYLDIADLLGARTLRSMVQAQEIAGGPHLAVAELHATLPRLEATGITLALETYEQVPTTTLLEIIGELATPLIGVCLDPANCVSALEHPRDVIDACATRAANLHVKDFAFTRQEGWVGFTYSGAPLGDGLLDLDHELTAVYFDRPRQQPPSAIVEHWLPWQGDLATTVATERTWTERTLDTLRTWRSAHLASPSPG